MFNSVSTLLQLYHCSQCNLPCFSRVLSTSTSYSNLSKLLAAFPHNRCQNYGQDWERNESQWLSLILGKKLAEPIGRARDLTSNLLFSSPVCYRLSYKGTAVFQSYSRLLTTLGKRTFENIAEKEKMLVTSIFSFSHNVFYPFQTRFKCLSKIFFVPCKMTWLWTSQEFCC